MFLLRIRKFILEICINIVIICLKGLDEKEMELPNQHVLELCVVFRGSFCAKKGILESDSIKDRSLSFFLVILDFCDKEFCSEDYRIFKVTGLECLV